METSRHLKLIISIFFILIGLFEACKSGEINSLNQSPPANTILVKVVDYSELDGCKFLLEMPDGQKLQPVNLPEKFNKNGVTLRITYKKKEGMSICMAGTMVELTYIGEVK